MPRDREKIHGIRSGKPRNLKTRMVNIKTRFEDLSLVQADPARVQQILLNLSSNAVDSMPKGGMLTFTTRNVSLNQENAHKFLDLIPGSYVLLKVSDTGTGMEPELARQIFEPFLPQRKWAKGPGKSGARAFFPSPAAWTSCLKPSGMF